MQATEIVKLIDTTRCTACRGCQIACKQWNEMPGKRTRNFGSYQNPPDLQWNTWTLIRFQEHVDQKGNLKWLFRKDGCMHCTDAACVKVCPIGGPQLHGVRHRRIEGRALHRLQELCGGLPLRGPQIRQARRTGSIKCDLCQTRLQADRQPSCVLSCPTGALTIGRKDTMLKAAAKRVQAAGRGCQRLRGQVRRRNPRALYPERETGGLRRAAQEPLSAAVDHRLERLFQAGLAACGGRHPGGLVPALPDPRAQAPR